MTITADDLVPEQLWQAIGPLLPPPPGRYGGRPRFDDRACLVQSLPGLDQCARQTGAV